MEEKKHMTKVEISIHAHPWRLDSYLAKTNPEFSRSFFQNLIKEGKVLVNDAKAQKSCRLSGGETIFWFEPAVKSGITPQNISIDIIYEDGDIIVVDKKPGLVVHPACGHPDGTILNALVWRAAGKYFPYLIHRLDKDTSGILVVAKSERAKLKLTRQFQKRTVEKTYIAVIKGKTDFKRAFIDAPLGRSIRNRFKIEVGSGTKKDSATEVLKIKEGNDHSIVEVRPKTGRTHQIRAHFSYINHPVLGDALYGGAYPGASRPLLHAYKIKFVHPSKNRKVEFVAPIPPDIKAYI